VKRLPVKLDIQENLVWLRLHKDAMQLEKVVGDLALIAFYYLLHISKCTVKGTKMNQSQTQQFEMADATFPHSDKQENLCQLTIQWHISSLQQTVI
jgi:hypothetical protein